VSWHKNSVFFLTQPETDKKVRLVVKCLVTKKRKGSAMVEMALVLPLLILLLVGIVEFSRVLMVKQVITNAAREGARAASIRLDDAGAISTAFNTSRNYLSASGVDVKSAQVNSSFLTTSGSPAIQVVVTYSYNSMLTKWIPGIPEILTLRSAAIMRREA